MKIRSFKRKNLSHGVQRLDEQSSPSTNRKVSKRASRREWLQEMREIEKKGLIFRSLIEFFFNIVRPHWAAFVFWPLFGLVFGFMIQFGSGCCSYDISLISLLAGVGIAIFFSMGENKFSWVVLGVFGSFVGYVVAMFAGDAGNAPVFAGVGFGIGLLGRWLIPALLRGL